MLSSRPVVSKIEMIEGKDGSEIERVLATPATGPEKRCQMSYIITKTLGKGSYGIVRQAKHLESGELVAIKRIKLDNLIHPQELNVMKTVRHCNITPLLFYFYTYVTDHAAGNVYLYMVMECFPETLHSVIENYSLKCERVPIFYVAMYTYQILRGLAYMHYLGFCHRDLKPKNILVNSSTGVVKICDFGSAQQFVELEANTNFHGCTLHYTAPELLFRCSSYTVKIDVWSVGCILGELLLGSKLLYSLNELSLITKILHILGTPTSEDLAAMNVNFNDHFAREINPTSWDKIFHPTTPKPFVTLVSKLLQYKPSLRPTPLEICTDPVFNILRAPGATMLNNHSLPPLFDLSPRELKIQPYLNAILLPKHQSPRNHRRRISL